MLFSLSVSEAQLYEIKHCRASLGICCNLSCLATSIGPRNRAKCYLPIQFSEYLLFQATFFTLYMVLLPLYFYDQLHESTVWLGLHCLKTWNVYKRHFQNSEFRS